jgi:hypothetical protein
MGSPLSQPTTPLHGAEAIAEFIFGDRKARRRVLLSGM